MNIRRAGPTDIPRINDLLLQVMNIHAEGRPDIFIHNTRKYTPEELTEIIGNDLTPVFVAVDENDYVLGYAFCIYQETKNSNGLKDMKTLYIDDLCVDSQVRGRRIGTMLYERVINEARMNGCYHVTLNVWSLNDSAMHFYEKMGMKPLKTVMETKL